MLNNKGQSLVLFVIILPIILLILEFVIDIGMTISIKSELENISDIVLDYGLDHLDEEDLINKMDEIVRLNKDDIDNVNLSIIDNKIYLELNERYKGMFSSFVDISIFDIKVSYVGYMEEDIKRIENLGD